MSPTSYQAAPPRVTVRRNILSKRSLSSSEIDYKTCSRALSAARRKTRVMGRTALILGATGLVGRHVTERLIRRAEWDRVVVVVRRPTGLADPKLTEIIADFDALGAHADAMNANDVFACLGTTIKVAGSKERFRRVDYAYTLQGARIAHERGASRLCLVSSVGAHTASSNFYLQVKGDTERDARLIGYAGVTVARPSVLLGERAEKRSGERFAMTLGNALGFAMIGGLQRYRPIDARVVADALVAAAIGGERGTRIVEYAQLVALARSLTGT